MADPYTPETIDVKVAYCTSFDPGFAHKVMAHTVAEMTTGHAGDFDRWLEKHDREVRAAALEAEARTDRYDRPCEDRLLDAADATRAQVDWAKVDHTADQCQFEECPSCGCCAHGKEHVIGCSTTLDRPLDTECPNTDCACKGGMG